MNIYPENVMALGRDLSAIEKLIIDVTAELNRRGHPSITARIAPARVRDDGEYEPFSALFRSSNWTIRAYPEADSRYIADCITEKQRVGA